MFVEGGEFSRIHVNPLVASVACAQCDVLSFLLYYLPLFQYSIECYLFLLLYSIKENIIKKGWFDGFL